MSSEQVSDDWTIPSTVDSSFVDVSVAEDSKDDVLKLSVTPKHESIGIYTKKPDVTFSGIKKPSGLSAFLKKPKETDSNGFTQACVTIKASDLPANFAESKSNLDLMVSLDISGSMEGKKLRDCISTLEAMLRPLGPKDRFGLITFGSEARVKIPASFMTKENNESALKQIKAIQTSGMTNLSGGLALAWEELKLIKNPNAVRSIFLLTDGAANRGVTKTEDLVTMVKTFDTHQTEQIIAATGNVSLEETAAGEIPGSIHITKKQKSNAPVSLFCFGYGADHNSAMLQAISEATPGGAYYFVEKEADVATAFGDAMGGLLTVLAQSAVLRISVPPTAAAKGVKVLDVHHDEKIKRGDGAFTVSLGDFYAEESRDVLFDLELSTVPSDTPVPHVQVSLSYMDIVNKKNAQAGPVELAIARPPNSEMSPMNLYVESQWIRVSAVQQMEAADKEAQANQLESARDRLKKTLDCIKSSPAYNVDNPLIVALESDVKEVLDSFQSRMSYQTTGGHKTKNLYRSHKTQRCMKSSAIARSYDPYETKSKAATQIAFSKNID